MVPIQVRDERKRSTRPPLRPPEEGVADDPAELPEPEAEPDPDPDPDPDPEPAAFDPAARLAPLLVEERADVAAAATDDVCPEVVLTCGTAGADGAGALTGCGRTGGSFGIGGKGVGGGGTVTVGTVGGGGSGTEPAAAAPASTAAAAST